MTRPTPAPSTIIDGPPTGPEPGGPGAVPPPARTAERAVRATAMLAGVALIGMGAYSVLTWTLLRARIIKWAAGPLNAKGSDVAIEEMVLSYERLEVE